MAVVGICGLCGADLADDGERVCDCQRERAQSRLVRVVSMAVRLAGQRGDLRRALRDAAWAERVAS